ncbi:MAG TPA: amidohydrolase family protein, partial [Aquihabitans sp.]|nr:amidohydrolase family protein [Aquihabitans sp.]
MLDQLITGGTVVDGTGAAPRRADVGIRDGRIVAVGEVTEDAVEVLDATGLLVLPGIIDPHTHYDAQLFWDPGASPSNVHGVTTVVGGNCGFTLAPLRATDAAYTREMLASVEGMSVAALEEGVPWDWETFADYLDRLEGNVGVNAAFLVGHCALRRYVMGADAVGQEASPEQLAEMERVLAESLEAGGLGFSTTLSRTHSDGDGQPVASRWSTPEELLALCTVG